MTRIELLFDKLKRDYNGLGIELKPPVKPAQLKKLEAIVKHRLPEDFKTFYLLSNGFDTTDLLFSLLPIETIVAEIGTKKMVFAEYMIFADCWEIIHNSAAPDNYKIVNNNHGADETITLCNSLFDFIERYIEGGGILGKRGLYNWYEEQRKLEIGDKSP